MKKFIYLALALINIPFIILDPSRWWSAMFFGFCFALFFASMVREVRDHKQNIEI